MSLVTNVILCAEPGEEQVTLEMINEFLDKDDCVGKRGFSHINDFAGGTKRLEADVYVGAFNYLQLEKLKEHIRSLPWEDIATVQLFVKEQDDESFTERLHKEGPK